MTPPKALERLFTAEKASAAWFTEGFLAKVPIEKIDAVTGQVRAASGAFKRWGGAFGSAPVDAPPAPGAPKEPGPPNDHSPADFMKPSENWMVSLFMHSS